MDHLVCFMGGSLGLGAYTDPSGRGSPRAARQSPGRGQVSCPPTRRAPRSRATQELIIRMGEVRAAGSVVFWCFEHCFL